MHFETPTDYLVALKENPALAILPIQMVADMRSVGRGAIDAMLRSGKLAEIRVGKTRYVKASGLIDLLNSKETRVTTVTQELEKLARRRKTVTYEPIMAKIGLDWHVPADRAAIGAILGTISTRTWAEKTVLLTALVHRKTAGVTRPGPGFFELAEHLNVESVRPWETKNELVENEMKAVWDAYAA
jgi:hypothetical protein